jgi:isopentenyl-diphosphate delta-isomerase
MSTDVILVDENDQEIGVMEKNSAHELGLLHRAFSVFIFNEKNELLLQQRAATKYHSPNQWANTCCSHPYPNETLDDAASRRLKEEMGISCELHKLFSFTYKATMDNGLIEHEIDHVFVGNCEQNPQPNPEEVAQFKWISINDLKKEMIDYPQQYTEWFKIIFKYHSDQFIQVTS